MPSRTAFSLVLVAVLLSGVRPAAAQWPDDGIVVCAAASNQLTPVTAPDGAGGAIVAWYDYRNGTPDIYVQRVLSSGALDPAWPAGGRVLCGAAGGQYAPVIVPDASGGAIIAWYDDRGPSSDIYAQRVLASGAPDPAWPVNGVAVCTASGDQVYPAIATDGAGGAFITWRDDRGGPDTDIFAQRVLASGTVDPAWPVNGLALCTAPQNQSAPAVAPDGGGGALVAWSDLRGGSHSDIYALRVTAAGAPAPGWPANGRALCLAGSNQSGPTIVGDGTGGAVVAWYDTRSNMDADIYAQRVLAGGAVDPAWPSDGRALCTAAGDQYSPVAVPDGAGGAILVWYDYRAGEEADVFASRVTGSGALAAGWPADGAALCVADGDQVTPGVVADGMGGAVAAWLDYRHGPSSDVYAQRVRSHGSIEPSWGSDGAALCTATREQYSPSAVVGEGAVIVAWTDFRPGVYSDIYAQRRVLAGGVAAVADARWMGGLLHPIRPNPSRSGVRLRVEMPVPGRATIEVLDLGGRRVRGLIAGRELAAGRHELVWDGSDDLGRARRSGVYWVRVTTAAGVASRRLALVR